MKCRIKKTGEIINISEYADVELDKCNDYGDPIRLGFDEVEFIQEKQSDIDWEQRRYEIAKSVYAYTNNISAKDAVRDADKLIEQLRMNCHE